MRSRSLWAILLSLVLSLGVAACGGDEDEPGGTGSGAGTPAEGKQGGKLTALWTDDVDFIDPGRTYYQMGVMVTEATQRPLYGYEPDDGATPVPDLAESAPEASADNKTVTVKIKQGVKFSPPVDREVTSKDVKYAIERGFFNNVNNGYAGAYFGAIQGAKVGVKPGTEIPGIQTPDDQTIVFKLSRPEAGTLVNGALGMNLTAPVPPEYAKEYDAKPNESTYGEYQVATGPYMIENNAAGKAIGYEPGKRIHLVRNPNWDKATDFKPAYLDEIDMPQGNDDSTVASRKVLEGQSLITGDVTPPPAILKQATTQNKDQLQLVPSGGGRYVSLNTSLPPFDDINVRKAVLAGFDRNAMRLTRGGKLIGDIATHFIPPGISGFEESGGLKGFGLDFMSETGEPNPEVAAGYFKKAGFASGKYEGTDEILMVGTSEGVAQKAAEVAKENFERLGFKVRLRLVTTDSMYTKFCNVPSAKVQVCPNTGWLKDFSDPQTLLDPTFNGENILPQNNSNWPELDVKALNAEMNEAKQLTDQKERADAWAEVNRAITEQAPAVYWVWDKTPLLQASDVNGVVSAYNSKYHLAFTSLK